MSQVMRRTAAIGIVLPVRNEEELLPRALAALRIAGRECGCSLSDCGGARLLQ